MFPSTDHFLQDRGSRLLTGSALQLPSKSSFRHDHVVAEVVRLPAPELSRVRLRIFYLLRVTLRPGTGSDRVRLPGTCPTGIHETSKQKTLAKQITSNRVASTSPDGGRCEKRARTSPIPSREVCLFRRHTVGTVRLGLVADVWYGRGTRGAGSESCAPACKQKTPEDDFSKRDVAENKRRSRAGPMRLSAAVSSETPIM